MRLWMVIRQIVKDIYWTIVAIIVLALLLMIARDVYFKAYPWEHDKSQMKVYEELVRETYNAQTG